MPKMNIRYIMGLNSNRIEVKIYDNENSIFERTYYLGYDSSSCKEYAEYARQDYENAKKYGWKTTYCLKPYIGDILYDLVETNYINNEDINYSGYNVFAQKELEKLEVDKIFKNLFKEI